jgi:hypothetical protein
MSETTAPTTSHLGRPSKYTPSTIGKVIGSLQAGLSVESACEYAEIDPDTHYDWIKKYPDYSEKVTAARLYGKILASKQVTDVLQDVTREKPKYSESVRVTTAWKYLEKHEKSIYGSQSLIATKTETNDKGGVTTTIVHASDGTFTNFFDQFQQLRSATGHQEIDSGQLLEILEDSPSEASVAGGDDQGSTTPVHTKELQDQHTPPEGLSQP